MEDENDDNGQDAMSILTGDEFLKISSLPDCGSEAL
jgi:hypothetical protein